MKVLLATRSLCHLSIFAPWTLWLNPQIIPLIVYSLKEDHAASSGENETYAWEQVKTLVKAKLQGGSNHFAAEKVNNADDKERKKHTSVFQSVR